MKSRIGGLHLVLAFISFRRAQTLLLVLMGCALAGAVVGLATIRDSAQQAIDDSLRADLGQRTFALQTGNQDAKKVLSRLRWASPVQDSDGDVTAAGLSDSVSIRTTTDASLHLGILTEGSRPDKAGEVLLTQSTAKALRIKLGDTITIRNGDGQSQRQVVGLSIDPANPSNRTLVELIGPTEGFAPTRWLSNRDFYSEPLLKPFLDSRTATYQSVGPLLEAAAQNRPQFLSAFNFLPAGSGLLMAVVLLSAITVMSRTWKSYAAALLATGMPQVRAWRAMFGIVFGLVAIGEVIGVMGAVAVLSFFRVPVSNLFAQYWVEVSTVVFEPAVVIALTMLSGLVAVQVVRLTPTWTAWVTARRGRDIRWRTPLASLGFGVAFVAWVGAIKWRSDTGGNGSAPDLNVVTVITAAIVMAATLPYLIAAIAGRGLSPVTRIVFHRIVNGLAPVLAIGAVIALTSSLWSAQTTHEANAGEAASSPLEPAGSFVISAMPNAAIESLASIYRAQGGLQVSSYEIPDETSVNLRVTSPGLISCMAERRTTDPNTVPPSCFPQRAASSINTVMIGAPGSTPRADPSLLQDGKVGLLLFPANSGSAARLATTDAQPDPTLGGNLPGLVVPPDSNVVKEFGLVAGGRSEILLHDFHDLTPDDRSYVRASVMRLASSGETSDGTDPTAYDRLRSVANTVSTLGALAAAVVLLLGGASIVVAHELVRRTLIDLGAASAPRRHFWMRITAVPLTTLIIVVPLTLSTASLGDFHAIDSYGIFWLLPAVSAILASLVIATALRRAPASTNNAVNGLG